MEYERALFRVHDRTLESLKVNEPCFPQRCGDRVTPVRVCAAIEVLLLSFAGLCLLLLAVAHGSFVGANAPSCVLEQLNFLQGRDSDAWAEAHPPGSTNLTAPGFELLGKNTILALKIDEHGASTKSFLQAADAAAEAHPRHAVNNTWTSQFVPDYRFSATPALLALTDHFVKAHDVEVLNVTVASSCFTRGDGNREAVVGLLGYDTIIINQLLTALESTGGLLENSQTSENWYWRRGYSTYAGDKTMPFGEALSFKLWVVAQTTSSFFFTATVTVRRRGCRSQSPIHPPTHPPYAKRTCLCPRSLKF